MVIFGTQVVKKCFATLKNKFISRAFTHFLFHWNHYEVMEVFKGIDFFYFCTLVPSSLNSATTLSRMRSLVGSKLILPSTKRGCTTSLLLRTSSRRQNDSKLILGWSHIGMIVWNSVMALGLKNKKFASQVIKKTSSCIKLSFISYFVQIML